MAALDFIVSTASNIFIPSYDGNMAKLVEGHSRYRGYKITIQLDRKTLVRLLDLLQNRTLSWDEFSAAVQQSHEGRIGQPARRRFIEDKPKKKIIFTQILTSDCVRVQDVNAALIIQLQCNETCLEEHDLHGYSVPQLYAPAFYIENKGEGLQFFRLHVKIL